MTQLFRFEMFIQLKCRHFYTETCTRLLTIAALFLRCPKAEITPMSTSSGMNKSVVCSYNGLPYSEYGGQAIATENMDKSHKNHVG